MKYQIKRTTLTFRETLLSEVFDSKEDAAKACLLLNKARTDFYSVVEIQG